MNPKVASSVAVSLVAFELLNPLDPLVTGLDTKKKIVAKFGENATFEKGKPLPKAVKAA